MLYYIQECYNDGTIHEEWSEERFDSNHDVIEHAKAYIRHATCREGDYLRILTIDSELVWDSRKDD